MILTKVFRGRWHHHSYQRTCFASSSHDTSSSSSPSCMNLWMNKFKDIDYEGKDINLLLGATICYDTLNQNLVQIVPMVLIF